MSVTMREMLEAGVHFGHQTRFWNPKMAPFIFGHRNKIHIINLEQSLPMFQDAAKFARQLSANRGTILMVGTKRQAREIVATEARRAGVPFVDQRWLGGMLTNFKTVKTSIKRLKDMKAQLETGLDAMSKKEQLMFNRELEKLEKDIGGIQDMATLPDAIFVIDVGYHKIAIAEAKKLGIPLIGVVDTNHSPEGIDYVIPGNDDSSKAVTLYARGIADAILEGRANAVQEVVKAVTEGEDEFVEVDSASDQSLKAQLFETAASRGLVPSSFREPPLPAVADLMGEVSDIFEKQILSCVVIRVAGSSQAYSPAVFALIRALSAREVPVVASSELSWIVPTQAPTLCFVSSDADMIQNVEQIVSEIKTDT